MRVANTFRSKKRRQLINAENCHMRTGKEPLLDVHKKE